MFGRLKTLCQSAAVVAALAAAGAAEARELRIVVGVPPGSAAQFGVEAFAADLAARTGNDLTVKIFPPSLLDLVQTFGGIRDGVVDGGYLVLNFHAADLRETQLPIELAMLGANPYAMAGAMSEYVLTCEPCVAERLAANMVPLGNASTGSYAILGTSPMTTPDELKGKKLRAAGGAWSRWAAAMGAVGVSMPGNEIFEGMSQRTIDGAMNAPTELTSIRLKDVATHVTLDVPGGTVHGLDISSVNRDTWRSLTTDQRKAWIEAAALGNASATWKFVTDVAKNIEDAKAAGIVVANASPELKAASQAAVEADLANIAKIAADTHGIQDADAKIARFRALVTKWEGLLPTDRDWTADQIADVFRAEIYSKLDPATYGM